MKDIVLQTENLTKKYVGSMIEAPALYPNYSVIHNLELQRILMGNPDKAVCDKVLDMVGLTEVSHKKVKNLSMGMKQRLGIAKALIGNPKVLILDEPINGLDPKNIVALRNMLKKLNEERNVTIFISSHILNELYLLATDYIFIHKGRIIENPDYKVLSDNTIHLYSDAVDMEEISKTFMDNNIVITGLSVMEQTLEDYFISITGGEDYV